MSETMSVRIFMVFPFLRGEALPCFGFAALRCRGAEALPCLRLPIFELSRMPSTRTLRAGTLRGVLNATDARSASPRAITRTP
jgi:hypothetical protein